MVIYLRMKDIEVRVYLPAEQKSRIPVGFDAKAQPLECNSARVQYIAEGTHPKDRPECDGIWTDKSDLILETYGYDCIPFAISDGEKIGVFHAGYKQLFIKNNIFKNALKIFLKEKVKIVLGPFIHDIKIKDNSNAYWELANKFGPNFFKGSPENGYLTFSFKEAVLEVLEQEYKIPKEAIILDPRNTKLNYPQTASRRAEKESGKDYDPNTAPNYICIGERPNFKDESDLGTQYKL